ncbi:MAG: hypothetical protein R6U21_01195 [Thermoplasmatota archaeon]
MKKITIILLVFILMSTPFVSVSQATINSQNTFLRTQDGPLTKIVDFFKNIPFINQIINFFQKLFGIDDTTDSGESDDSGGADEYDQPFIPTKSDSIKDSTNDIMHYNWNNGRYIWNAGIENKPNIDITEIKYAIGENKIKLSMTVDGNIFDSEMISYHMHLNTSDSYYYFIWLDGEGVGMATATDGKTFQGEINPEITASGTTITATFNIIGTSTKIEALWGFAAEYTEYGDTSAEWWVDYAPNEESPYTDDTNPTTGDVSGGTSGFEVFSLLTAFLLIAVFFQRKRKK